jgi:hypothetical protein
VRLVLVVWLALAASVASVGAQTPETPSEPTVVFLPRFDFHVSMEHLFSEEIPYVWDANFGGDIDLVSVGRTRATFVANYQTILGSEFRAFDPNQGNYILEGSVSVRAGAVEAAGVFHHVSRHLSDRPKRNAVDWNMVGGRVRGGGRHARIEYDARVDVRRVIQHTFVDYRWEIDGEVATRLMLQPRVALMATGAWRMLGVDGTRGRDNQHGFRGEGGVRLVGRSAALELFLAAEQRVDPYQLEFSTVRWLTAGFRISGPGPSRVP